MPIHPLCRQPVRLVGRVQPSICFDGFVLIFLLRLGTSIDWFALIDSFCSLLMLLPFCP
jgi:hypothetical protein